MKIETDMELIGNVYHPIVLITAVTPAEGAQLDYFGEPQIDLGGSFSGSATRQGGSPVSVTFTLPDQLVSLPSSAPYKQVFSLDDSVNSDIMAVVWTAAIVSRITTAKTTLMSLVPNFVGQAASTV